jgi:serine/threonine protein kinase
VRNAANCPTAAALQSLASGRLPEWEAESLARHLGRCPPCEAAYDALFQPIIQALRTAEPAGTHPEWERIDHLISRLERLTQAGENAAGAPTVNEGSGQAADTDAPVTSVRPEAVLAPPQAAGEIGRLGKYRVLEVLGRGGMGIVFRGEDTVLRRPAALKVIKQGGTDRPDLRQRFLREARAVAALNHDHVVPIWDVDENAGTPFIVMPLLKGESLAARLRREPRLPLPLVLQIGRETASALAAAHAAGVIHRDLKPENLWLETQDQGVRVRVLDFGLAVAPEAGRMTQLGTLLGTPQYMAPEQARGDPADARSDLFSLGCVLYELTTGSRPFHGDNVLAVLSALENRVPRLPHEVDEAVPRDLSDLIVRLLAKKAEDRPGSALEVVEALRRAPPGSPSANASPDPRRTFWRRPRVAATIFAAALLVIAVITIALAGGKGRLVIETDDPQVEVLVNQQKVTIVDRAGARRYELVVGEHDLKPGEYVIAGSEAGGLRFSVDRFTIERGGKVVVKVSLQKEKAPPPPPAPRPSYEGAVREGLAFCEDHKEKQGLLWLARALELAAANDAKAQWYVRINLAAWITQQHRETGPYVQGDGPIFSPDGTRLLVRSRERRSQAQCYDVLSGKPLGPALQAGQLQLDQGVFSADGRSVFVRADKPGIAGTDVILHFDVPSGEIKQRFIQTESTREIVLSPDGRTVVTTSLQTSPHPRLYFWDITTNALVGKPIELPSPATRIALRPDGKVIAAGSFDGKLRFWNTATRQPFGQVLTTDSGFFSIVFSPDGKRLLSVAGYRAADLWEAATGRRIASFSRDLQIVAAAFSRDGRLAATSGHDQLIRLWETATGRQIGPPANASVDGLLHDPTALIFTPDGKKYQAASGVWFTHWPVPTPLEGTAERITLWAEVTARMRLDEEGRMHPLDDEGLSQRRRRLDALGGAP